MKQEKSQLDTNELNVKPLQTYKTFSLGPDAVGAS